MLVLNRKRGQSIIINDKIRITILGWAGGGVKLGFEAPEETLILREELVIQAELEEELREIAEPVRSKSNGNGNPRVHD